MAEQGLDDLAWLVMQGFGALWIDNNVAFAICWVIGLSSAFGQLPSSPLDQAILQLDQTPVDQRTLAIRNIASDIRSLPPSGKKIQLAWGLANAANDGYPDQVRLQLVADTFALALAQAPQPADTDDGTSPPFYSGLASLYHYEHLTFPSDPRLQPMLGQAEKTLQANDAEVSHADFTLKDLTGKQWTLSSLRGRVVLVNFWATWCDPCVKEMPDLESLYRQYAPQGLVVLALTSEDGSKVRPYVEKYKYTLPVLLDPERAIQQRFHVAGIPHSFIFNRSEQLVDQTISARSKLQMSEMLFHAGLKR